MATTRQGLHFVADVKGYHALPPFSCTHSLSCGGRASSSSPSALSATTSPTRAVHRRTVGGADPPHTMSRPYWNTAQSMGSRAES